MGRSLPRRRLPDEAVSQRLLAIREAATKAAAEVGRGRLNQAHLTLLQIRPMLAQLRQADELATYAAARRFRR